MRVDFTKIELSSKHYLMRLLAGAVVTIMVRARGLILIPFITLWWTPENLYLYRLFILTAVSLTPFFGLNLHTGLQLSSMHLTDKADISKRFFSALLSSLLIFVGVSLLALGIGHLFIDPMLIDYIPLILLLILATIGRQFVEILPIMYQRTKIRILLLLSFEYGSFAVILWQICNGADAVQLAWAYLALMLAIDGVMLVLISIDLGCSLSIQSKYTKLFITVALPLMPVPILLRWMESLDLYFVGYFHSRADGGTYTIAASFATLVNMFSYIIGFSYLSTISKLFKEKNMEDFRAYILHTFRACLMVLGFVAFLYCLFADVLLNLFVLNDQFKPSLDSMRHLGIGHILFVLANILLIMLYASEKSKTALLILCSALSINVVLNLLLIPTMNYDGAAIATLISYAFVLICSYLASRNFWQIGIKLTDIGTVITACAITIYITKILIDTLQLGLWTKLYILPVSALLYISILMMTKVVTKHDLSWLWQNIRTVISRLLAMRIM